MSLILADPTDPVATEPAPSATPAETATPTATPTATVTTTATVTSTPSGPAVVTLDADQYGVLGIGLALVLAVVSASLVASWRRS